MDTKKQFVRHKSFHFSSSVFVFEVFLELRLKCLFSATIRSFRTETYEIGDIFSNWVIMNRSLVLSRIIEMGHFISTENYRKSVWLEIWDVQNQKESTPKTL